MSQAQAISLRRVAALDLALKFSRWVNWLALAACAAVVLYVAGYFLFEWLVPPTPAVVNPDAPGALFFGADDGRRAIRLVTPGLRWLSRILFFQSVVQIFVSVACLRHNRPGAKKLVAGVVVNFVSVLLALAASASCGCAVPLD